MRKIWILLTVVFVISLIGCSKQNKLETPPWSETQIEQMQEDEVETVPFGIIRS